MESSDLFKAEERTMFPVLTEKLKVWAFIPAKKKRGGRDGSVVTSTCRSSEDPALIASTQIGQLPAICHLSSRGSDVLSYPLRMPDLHMVHRHTYIQPNTDTYKIKNKM